FKADAIFPIFLGNESFYKYGKISTS
ncbi:hypothetical protein AAA799N04_01914, partial [Marine Group I thaumarchaeote SCGC AAA799-N04]